MNLWLRLIWLWFSSRFRPRLASLEPSRISMIVLPNDLDTNLHMNNGRYLTLMDLGRADIFLRSGFFAATRSAGWTPVLSAASIRYRRELRLWRRFTIETRIVYWEATAFVMEHRILITTKEGREAVAAQALMRGGLYDRTAKAFVPVDDLFVRMKVEAHDSRSGRRR